MDQAVGNPCRRSIRRIRRMTPSMDAAVGNGAFCFVFGGVFVYAGG
jgi:hypothetical protein